MKGGKDPAQQRHQRRQSPQRFQFAQRTNAGGVYRVRKLRRRGAVGRHVQMRVRVAAEATEPFRAADLRLQQIRARIRWKEEACSKNLFVPSASYLQCFRIRFGSLLVSSADNPERQLESGGHCDGWSNLRKREQSRNGPGRGDRKQVGGVKQTESGGGGGQVE